MTDNRGDNDVFRRSIYRKTLLDMRTLGQKMPEDTLELLAREVLHRLTLQSEAKGIPDGLAQDQEIEKLCRDLLSDDPLAGSRYVSELRLRGVDLDTLYLAYLAGAARKLGVWWEEDEITFIEVTTGTSRIYGIMRGLNPLFVSSLGVPHRSALFASCPGETHTLGVKMASDLFRKDGWDIDLKIGRSHDDLIEDIANSPCVLIGLSAAGEHAIARLAKLIVAIRVVRPECLILVSGNIVNVSTEIVSLMAPDAMAIEYEEAEAEMESLLERVSGTIN
jgi:methanogenic corrinoid protein MtbC1